MHAMPCRPACWIVLGMCSNSPCTRTHPLRLSLMRQSVAEAYSIRVLLYLLLLTTFVVYAAGLARQPDERVCGRGGRLQGVRAADHGRQVRMELGECALGGMHCY